MHLIFSIGFLLFSNLIFAEGNPGFTPHKPLEFIDNLGNKNDEQGKKIYQAYCSLCHNENPSIKLGAPRFGQVKDWTNRMAKGFDEAYKNLDEGIGAMPARGGCFECSDEMLRAAMYYLIPNEVLDATHVEKTKISQ